MTARPYLACELAVKIFELDILDSPFGTEQLGLTGLQLPSNYRTWVKCAESRYFLTQRRPTRGSLTGDLEDLAPRQPGARRLMWTRRNKEIPNWIFIGTFGSWNSNNPPAPRAWETWLHIWSRADKCQCPKALLHVGKCEICHVKTLDMNSVSTFLCWHLFKSTKSLVSVKSISI